MSNFSIYHSHQPIYLNFQNIYHGKNFHNSFQDGGCWRERGLNCPWCIFGLLRLSDSSDFGLARKNVWSSEISLNLCIDRSYLSLTILLQNGRQHVKTNFAVVLLSVVFAYSINVNTNFKFNWKFIIKNEITYKFVIRTFFTVS